MTDTLDSPPDLIAAIGDVHGRADLLETMLSGLEDTAEKRGHRLRIFLLGDIVDRGSENCRAMSLTVAALARHPGSRLFVGNHDDWLLRLLDADLDEAEFEHWLGQGGAQTLLSYGLRNTTNAAEARAVILENHPDHAQALREASIIETVGAFAFVHAGIDPERPIDNQSRHDCLWIRDPFQHHVGRLSHVIVHGHQPQKGGAPVATENRISMDTGAVVTDVLSAVVVDAHSERLDFLAARPHGRFGLIEPVRSDRGLGTVLDDWRVNADS